MGFGSSAATFSVGRASCMSTSCVCSGGGADSSCTTAGGGQGGGRELVRRTTVRRLSGGLSARGGLATRRPEAGWPDGSACWRGRSITCTVTPVGRLGEPSAWGLRRPAYAQEEPWARGVALCGRTPPVRPRSRAWPNHGCTSPAAGRNKTWIRGVRRAQRACAQERHGATEAGTVSGDLGLCTVVYAVLGAEWCGAGAQRATISYVAYMRASGGR